jgi:hypothetical protein
MGSYLFSLIFELIDQFVGMNLIEDRLEGLLYVTGVVLERQARIDALVKFLLFGLLTTTGVCYATWDAFKNQKQLVIPEPNEIIRFALLAFTGSWLAWYLFLSVGWERYLFPALFIGSIFTSAFIHRMTNGFNLGYTAQVVSSVFFKRNFSRVSLGTLCVVALVSLQLSLTLLFLVVLYTSPNNSVQQVAEYLNHNTPQEALVESYDSELFFLLDRRYHYPPNEINIPIISRVFLKQEVPLLRSLLNRISS